MLFLAIKQVLSACYIIIVLIVTLIINKSADNVCFLEVNEVIDSFYLTQIMATVYEKRLGKKYNKMSYFATVGFKNVPLLKFFIKLLY